MPRRKRHHSRAIHQEAEVVVVSEPNLAEAPLPNVLPVADTEMEAVEDPQAAVALDSSSSSSETDGSSSASDASVEGLDLVGVVLCGGSYNTSGSIS